MTNCARPFISLAIRWMWRSWLVLFTDQEERKAMTAGLPSSEARLMVSPRRLHALKSGRGWPVDACNCWRR